MVNESPPSTLTHERLGNTSASQRYDIVHSPEPGDAHQLPAVVGSQTSFSYGAGGPAARNVGRPPVRYTEGRQLPLPVLPPIRYYGDYNLPNYRGYLALFVIFPLGPRNATLNEYFTTSIPHLYSEGGNHILFEVFFKRNLSLLSIDDMAVAHTYIDNFRLRGHLLAIYREARHLKRIWIIDPDLITGLLPSGQASTTFMQNHRGLYLECRCGAYIYVGQYLEVISEWTHCWDLHISLSTRTSHGIQYANRQEFNE